MQASYIPFIVAVVIAAALSAVMVLASDLLGPRKHTPVKDTAYECGTVPVGSARERVPVRFYLVAAMFIIFDVEVVFLYPWAAAFAYANRAERIFLLYEMGVFVLILVVAYVYLACRGVFDWSPEDEEATSGVHVPAQARFVRRPPIRFGNEDSGPVAPSSAAKGPAQ